MKLKWLTKNDIAIDLLNVEYFVLTHYGAFICNIESVGFDHVWIKPYDTSFKRVKIMWTTDKETTQIRGVAKVPPMCVSDGYMIDYCIKLMHEGFKEKK